MCLVTLVTGDRMRVKETLAEVVALMHDDTFVVTSDFTGGPCLLVSRFIVRVEAGLGEPADIGERRLVAPQWERKDWP